MNAIFFLVALFACLIGKICGMGGGVIIKPVLDAFGVMSVAAINFISGCTVLGMSLWSVGSSVIKKESAIDWRISTPLAFGAAAGGILGKMLFDLVEKGFENPDRAGGVQAAILFILTLGVLLYTVFKDRLPSYHVNNLIACFVIGLGLGALGSFLGIGGGPFNMAVLFFFFTMSTKTAAQNSLYVIMISQLTALLRTVASGKVPEVLPLLLFGMVACGILGSFLGQRLNRKMNDKTVTKLLIATMGLVMAICVYNMARAFS